MLIFPAIDLLQGQAVRLYKGDYAQKTVYSDDPVSVAMNFKAAGAGQIHLVDLEGAKSGDTPNLELICRIKKETGLFCEVGGGIRNLRTMERYLSAGIDRVILGTAAVTEEGLVEAAVARFGEKIALGVDLKDGMVAIRGWTSKTDLDAFSFCEKMQKAGVKPMICTDISRVGAMQGTNRELYRQLSERFSMQIIASGGVSFLEDIQALRRMNLYGAIIGKAYYTGAIDLARAIEEAR